MEAPAVEINLRHRQLGKSVEKKEANLPCLGGFDAVV
jgi:hypothetical protein